MKESEMKRDVQGASRMLDSEPGRSKDVDYSRNPQKLTSSEMFMVS